MGKMDKMSEKLFWVAKFGIKNLGLSAKRSYMAIYTVEWARISFEVREVGGGGGVMHGTKKRQKTDDLYHICINDFPINMIFIIYILHHI